MHGIRLVLVLGMLCCMDAPAYASQTTPPEDTSPKDQTGAQQPCDSDSGEPCPAEEAEEELERGFDPCLINANLPACKSGAERGEAGAAERTPSRSEEADDSG